MRKIGLTIAAAAAVLTSFVAPANAGCKSVTKIFESGSRTVTQKIKVCDNSGSEANDSQGGKGSASQGNGSQSGKGSASQGNGSQTAKAPLPKGTVRRTVDRLSSCSDRSRSGQSLSDGSLWGRCFRRLALRRRLGRLAGAYRHRTARRQRGPMRAAECAPRRRAAMTPTRFCVRASASPWRHRGCRP